MSTLGLLADDVGINERTLRRAINQGTLRASRPAPRRLALSLAERRYVRRSWPLLSALREALRTEHNVRFAVLFGSAARGTDTSASDVDVAVRLADARLDRIVDLGAKLTAACGRRVDLVRLEEVTGEPTILADLVREGRVLVAREGLWSEPQSQVESRSGHDDQRQGRRARAALAGIDRLLEREAP